MEFPGLSVRIPTHSPILFQCKADFRLRVTAAALCGSTVFAEATLRIAK